MSACNALIGVGVGIILGALGATGCSQEEVAAPEGQRLRIEIAPLTLPGIDEVTYGIRVLSATGVVWTKTGLTSTRFGDGRSALSYVGPCDASPSANPHTVEVSIEEIRAGGRALIDPVDWINPAPAAPEYLPIGRGGIVCLENSDVLVMFDITVLRSARQGFFDIGVEFADIFCSAKLDCVDKLLHNPATDGRDATVVVSLACTAGEGEETFVYISDLVLSCDDGNGATPPVTFTMPAPGMSPGQHGPVAPAPSSSLVGGVFEWAVYLGDEALTSNSEPLEKCYWNRAFGLDRGVLTGQTCTLSALGTATGSDLAAPLDIAELSRDGAYPFIRWNVQVLAPDGTLCGPNPLDGDGSDVKSGYARPDTSFSALQPMTGRYACGGEARTVTCPSAGAPIVVTQEQDGVITVESGGHEATVALPADYELGTNCCADACCGTLDP